MAKKITKHTAKKIARLALEKKAQDVSLLDLRKITSMTDFFIVCTGSSNVQVKAIADHILSSCRKDDIEIHNVEGYDARRWVLVDMVDIVVHIFQPEVREYYQLERLWGDAPTDHFSDEAAETAR